MISKRSVALFKKAARQLPAYRQYLEDEGCDPKAIAGTKAFAERVPLTDKSSYLVPNRLEDLVWSKDLKELLLFCATSGSTGEPYYFPRNERLSWQYSHLLQEFIEQSSYGLGRTLVIIGFGMGVWIGGVITLRAFEIAAQRARAPISILPTGYNKIEIYKALRRLAPNFDQTIIVGYPPFVKELIDDARKEGVNLAELHIRLLFAAEAFTESFRDYVCQGAGVQDPLRDTRNIYGSADIGAMAHETPLSILIRRLVMNGDPMLRKALFKQIEKTPTLAQYNPDFIEFEEVNDEIVLTGDGALPLIRYAVGDHGGVFDYQWVRGLFSQFGIDLEAEIRLANIHSIVNRNIPFVYVYERKNLAATLQGMIIYPEFIKETLIAKGMRRHFTQRFTMSTKHDIRHNQFLQINLELKKGVAASPTLKKAALEGIHRGLVQKSSEYAEVAKSRSNRKLLQIVLWPNGHPRYFAPGTKQRWVEKA